MDYARERVRGIEMAKQLGAGKTAATIEKEDSTFEEIFAAASAELGLDKVVAEILKGPATWAHMALLHLPDLGDHRAALEERAAEAEGVTPDDGAAEVEAEGPFAEAMGGPCSKFHLHNGMAATCQWTAKWMDSGEEQPTTQYKDWNDWLWSGQLTAGCSSEIALVKFGNKVPKSPLQKGDAIWIYVWVMAGKDISGKNLTFQFTYDPGSTKTVGYVATGTTTINQLSVAYYK